MIASVDSFQYLYVFLQSMLRTAKQMNNWLKPAILCFLTFIFVSYKMHYFKNFIRQDFETEFWGCFPTFILRFS